MLIKVIKKKNNFERRHIVKKINPIYCYLLLFIPLFLLFTIDFQGECDIWFLFSHGRYLLAHGFPHVDFLSMHEGLHFVMQQWVSSIIFYLSYRLLGEIGVYFVVWITTIFIMFFLFRLCKIICGDLFLSSVLTTIITVLLEFCLIVCRPGIFSLLIFIILLCIMESYVKKKNNKVYLLILLSFMLVNLHASMWPVLFVLLLPYVVHYFLLYFQKKDKTIFQLLLVMLFMIIVGFINPYGWEAMTYSFRSYGVSDINNIVWEMNGLNLSSELSYVKFFGYFHFFVMVTVSYIFIQAKKKVPLYRLLLFYGTCFMGMLNIRNISLFLICSIPFCSSYIPLNNTYLKQNNKILKWGIVGVAIVLGVFAYSQRERFIIIYKKIGQMEVLDYLNKHADRKEAIYTMSNHGNFYSYHGYKTYIDTRAELFLKKNNHKEDIFHESYLIMNGKINYSDFLKKYQFHYVVVDKLEPLYGYLKSDYNDLCHSVYHYKKLRVYECNYE